MNNSAQYCKTLENVTKEELINALHQMLLQLKAVDRALGGPEEGHGSFPPYDNKPIIRMGESLMAKAGHIGFVS